MTLRLQRSRLAGQLISAFHFSISCAGSLKLYFHTQNPLHCRSRDHTAFWHAGSEAQVIISPQA